MLINNSKFISSAKLNDQTANSKAYVEVISFHNTQIKHHIVMLTNNLKFI